MSEEDLLSAVTAGTRARPGLCKLLGLIWYHTRNSKRSPSGWPDLVIARPHVKGHGGGAVIFRELKSATGTVSPAQEVWLEALTWAGCDTGVWRPADLASGRIAAELQAIR